MTILALGPRPDTPIAVLGPASTGLARQGIEPIVVLTSPPVDTSFLVILARVDISGATCFDVFVEILRAEDEHFPSTRRRGRHLAVSGDVWQTLCENLGQRNRTGVEMLLRSLPWLDDVRVMSDGRPGTAFIY